MNQEAVAKSFTALAELVSRLRRPHGCPWDAQQTYDTIKTYLLEEAYEVVEAVDTGSAEDICSELGDLLFQILFLADIAEEHEDFDLEQVLEKITKKMITRHPHVFGTTKVAGPEEVAENWEKIKTQERGPNQSPSAYLQSIPANLPALLRAHRLSERVSKHRPEASGAPECWERVKEGFEALGKSVAAQDQSRVGECLGDLLFSLSDMARCWGHNAEHLLRKANREFLKSLAKGNET
ncbi:MAG: nucleoside triphosphate pyrophosphohydrolase [Deltaproteobacteria bacterium]|jgi:tetrapyrrole methylase family protein/MazG family protein